MRAHGAHGAERALHLVGVGVLASFVVLALFGASASRAAHIGVYADSLGTRPCVPIAPNTPTTLYVVATLDAPFESGIRGAEFRIEVERPQGWFVTYSPPRDAIHVGKTIDADGAPCTGEGVTLAFTGCRAPDVGTDRVALGKLVVTNAGGGPTHLLLKRHIAPGNPNFPCPLLIECNRSNDKHCIEPRLRSHCGNDEELRVGPSGYDAVYFATALNTPLESGKYLPRERHPERELVIVCDPDALRLPEDTAIVAFEAAGLESEALRSAFDAARVAGVGVAFEPSAECASEVEAAYAASLAHVGLLRFNHARTARKAIDSLSRLDDVLFVAPAAPFVVEREARFRMTSDVQEGARLSDESSFIVSLSKPAWLVAELLDVSGRPRATLHDALAAAGDHTFDASATLGTGPTSSGRDDLRGRAPLSGLFTLRLRAGGQEATYKVVLAGE